MSKIKREKTMELNLKGLNNPHYIPRSVLWPIHYTSITMYINDNNVDYLFTAQFLNYMR